MQLKTWFFGKVVAISKSYRRPTTPGSFWLSGFTCKENGPVTYPASLRRPSDVALPVELAHLAPCYKGTGRRLTGDESRRQRTPRRYVNVVCSEENPLDWVP